MSVFCQNIEEAAKIGQLHPGSEFWDSWVLKYCKWHEQDPEFYLQGGTLNCDHILLTCTLPGSVKPLSDFFGCNIGLCFPEAHLNIDNEGQSLTGEKFPSIHGKFVHIYNTPIVKDIHFNAGVYNVIESVELFENVLFENGGFVGIVASEFPKFKNCASLTRLDIQFTIKTDQLNALSPIWQHILRMIKPTNANTVGFYDKQIGYIDDVFPDIPASQNITVVFPNQGITFIFTKNRHAAITRPTKDGYLITYNTSISYNHEHL